MFNFFINYNSDGNYYFLTKDGCISIAILLVIVMAAAAFLFNHKQNAKISTKQLVFSAVSVATAFALSYIKIIQLPWGGSATLCSMLFVCLAGYYYGPKMGLMAAFSYGLLQLLQDGGSYIIHPFQICCDYVFSFMALGLSGFFSKKKHGLVLGYIAGIIGRLVFLSLGGYIFWMSYMPKDFPASLSAVYPIVYNGSFILTEGILTIAVLLIPTVNKGLSYIRKLATSESFTLY